MTAIKKATTTIALLATFFFETNSAFSQGLTQVVKGKVYDIESQATLPGANVVILYSNPILGTATDMDGNFRIENAPIGRHNIQISFVGYNSIIIPEVLVTSGKEVVLHVGLKQTVNMLGEAVVKARIRKDKPMNPMASVSAKTFTVEETQRYAGAIDDPARMVSAFAGVTVGNIQDNAIMVRGNSPKGVSWRLEGVEIPNPNHFAGANVAGGGFVTVLSSQLLANSDFFTGAFPAEYGNALAGVFDMKLRNGNTDKYEHTFQAGMLGLDFASEGSLGTKGKASYLINYRYSTFGILSKLGIVPSHQTPKYQDLSFKINLPTKKAGTFSLWGVGSKDFLDQLSVIDSTKWESDWDRVGFNWNLSTGVAGITHKILTSDKTYFNTSIAAATMESKMDAKRLDNDLSPRPNWNLSDMSSRITFGSFVNHKFSAKHTLRAGLNSSVILYNLNLSSTLLDNPDTYQNFVNTKGQSNYGELFIQSKYSILHNLVINSGVNINHFALNNNYSVEPRVSVKWDLAQNHSLALGYGKHSQLEELKIYMITKQDNSLPNKNLKPTEAHHIVLAYDWLIGQNVRLKVEPYYQYLYNIPSIPNTTFSMVNFKQDWTFRDSLANSNVGENYGVDFTFEKFLTNGYYYLVTASVFSSKYKADDGIWRNTRFNKGFVMNALVGKEFKLKKNRVIGVNGRFSCMGGERNSPVMVSQSIAAQQVIYNEARAFENQEKAMWYLDISISYRFNKTRFSSLWALSVKNILGTPLNEGYYYSYKTNNVEKSETVVVVPTLSYRIDF